jgi:hypothetical protein
VAAHEAALGQMNERSRTIESRLTSLEIRLFSVESCILYMGGALALLRSIYKVSLTGLGVDMIAIGRTYKDGWGHTRIIMGCMTYDPILSSVYSPNVYFYYDPEFITE